MKYICAAALGTPMLHYKWLLELEQKFQENGDARIFDHEVCHYICIFFVIFARQLDTHIPFPTSAMSNIDFQLDWISQKASTRCKVHPMPVAGMLQATGRVRVRPFSTD